MLPGTKEKDDPYLSKLQNHHIHNEEFNQDNFKLEYQKQVSRFTSPCQITYFCDDCVTGVLKRL